MSVCFRAGVEWVGSIEVVVGLSAGVSGCLPSASHVGVIFGALGGNGFVLFLIGASAMSLVSAVACGLSSFVLCRLLMFGAFGGSGLVLSVVLLVSSDWLVRFGVFWCWVRCSPCASFSFAFFLSCCATSSAVIKAPWRVCCTRGFLDGVTTLAVSDAVVPLLRGDL